MPIRSKLTKLLLALVAVLSALALAACGEKKEAIQPTSTRLQNLSLMLDWFPNADHVGLYQAIAEGDFAKVGLHVQVQAPSDPALPLKLLAAGKIDLAISYEPDLLIARNQNLGLVSIAAIVQVPLTSIVSIGSKHITTVAQLRGKKVGVTGLAYQNAYLSTVLAHAGVPASSVKVIDVGENLVPAMVSGRVDATLGAYWNYEAVQLQQLHKHPNVIHLDQVGVPTYNELVLVARQSTIESKADEIRRFVQALARGYESARANPQAAIDNLLAENPGLDRKLETAAVQKTLPAFFPSSPSNPWGWQDPTQWAAFGQWMLSQHLISNPNAPLAASSNDFLPGVGP
jgi:putative hydroxymethylpyrimidine transport system substrate-binding protein